MLFRISRDIYMFCKSRQYTPPLQRLLETSGAALPFLRKTPIYDKTGKNKNRT